jgi:hypothetical protein
MSENHIRAISTALSLLDKALCEFRYWAEGNEIRSVLHEIRNPLSPEQRQGISQLVEEMMTILDEIRETLDLEKSVRSADKTIVSSCSILWVSLTEIEGRYLGRYGEIPSGLAEILDPKLAVLTKKLRDIASVAAVGSSYK